MRDLPAAPPAARLFVGVHHRGGSAPLDHVFGKAIEFATLVRFGGSRPWVLGKYASTHAFVVVGPTGGPVPGWHRIDADIPIATVQEVHGFHGGMSASPSVFAKTALWEILPSTTISPAAGVAQAWRDSRTVYDIPQAAIQPLAGLASKVADHLGLPELPSDLLPRARICSELVCRALSACGGEAEQIARRVMNGDHLPEEIALEIQLVEHRAWCRRIL